MKDKRAMKKPITGNFRGTVLFIDIKNYLGISEILTPEQTCKFVLRVIEPLSECIKEHDGHICQIQGDAILAVFGLNTARADQAKTAVECAISLQTILKTLNPLKIGDIHIPLAASIGLCTGDLYSCYIKAGGYSEFTVLGRTVNLAARYQELNKHYDTNILIDESVFAYIKKDIVTRKLDKVEIEGCSEAMDLYEVIFFLRDKSAEKVQKKMNYERGLVNYLKEEWDEAINCFSQVGDDKVCYGMIDRCQMRKAFHEFIDGETNKQ